MQDVPAVILRKGMSFTDYFDPRRPAVLDADHAVRVNYETYLFADEAGAARFREDVVGSCGLLTDPISKRRFRPRPDAPRFEHEGVIYLFPDASARDMFARDPESHRLPGFRM